MPIRPFASILLICASLAVAAPPKSAKKPAAPPTEAPENVDVDALARAKDGTPDDAPPPAAVDTEAPAVDAAPAQDAVPPQDAAPPVTNAMPADSTPAQAPVAPPRASSAEPPIALTPPVNPVEKSLVAGCEARATALLDAAQKADFGGATRDFDAVMRSAMPPAKFKQEWDSLSQFGALTARGQSHLGKGDGYTIVMVPLIFEKTNLVAQIACGSDGRVAGFHVTQAPKPQF